ncbi:MAG: hypothetical protein L0154_03790 [Chloroflexi bacterium]|nr:hypothetical protein [Chloroflexota bacterium]
MRRFILLSSVWLLVLVGVLAVARRETPIIWIYFERATQLYRVSWDGSRVEALPLKDIIFVNTSPNGKWLLWYPRSKDELNLSSYILSETHQLTTKAAEPTWSPDSKQIAMTVDSKLTIFSINTGEWQKPDLPTVIEFEPQWSPDGEWLLFSGEIDGTLGLFRIRQDLTGFQQYELEGWASQAAWSPNGKWIAYRDYDQVDVFKMRSDGTEIQNLTRTVNTGEGLVGWDSSGEWLYFADEQGEVLRMRNDGSEVESFPNIPWYPSEWYQDWLVFEDLAPNIQGNLVRYNQVTHEKKQLTNSPFYDTNPHVVPPTDLNWHPETLAIGATLIFGVAAITNLRHRRMI